MAVQIYKDLFPNSFKNVNYFKNQIKMEPKNEPSEYYSYDPLPRNQTVFLLKIKFLSVFEVTPILVERMLVCEPNLYPKIV